MRNVFCGACTLIGLLAWGGAAAQTYPERNVRIVTSAAGTSLDVAARLIAQGISGPLGRPVIVDNRTPNLIGDLVAGAPPDGYTVLLHGSILWIAPMLQKTQYDVLRDFAPVTTIVTYPFALLTVPALPVATVKDLVVLARSKPNVYNYGSPPIGSPSYLAAELLKAAGGIRLVGVQYKSADLAMTGLLGGEVQMGFYNSVQALPQIRSGAVRALAVTSAEPSAIFPGLPTMAGTGLPGYVMLDRIGAFVPAKTPGAIVVRLNREIVQAIRQPEAKDKLFVLGLEVLGGSPEEFAADLRNEIAKSAKLISDAGIKVE
jgi:tripartite-type tricarboxylate transporter receptor subunit TctC